MRNDKVGDFGWFDEKRETLKEIRSNVLVFVLPPFNRQGKSMIWRWGVGGSTKQSYGNGIRRSLISNSRTLGKIRRPTLTKNFLVTVIFTFCVPMDSKPLCSATSFTSNKTLDSYPNTLLICYRQGWVKKWLGRFFNLWICSVFPTVSPASGVYVRLSHKTWQPWIVYKNV